MVLSPWTCVCGQRNAGPEPCSRCLNAAPMWVHDEPVVAERHRRHRWMAPLAAVTAVLLVSGVVGAAFARDRDEPAAPQDDSGLSRVEEISVTPEGATAEGLEGAARQIAEAIPSLMRFVAEARGLAYKHPVTVTLLPDKQFRQRLLEAEDEEELRERLETSERVLRALGLLEAGVDLQEARDALFGGAVAGFYDSETDDLVVRGERLTPSVRVTFVHELTHALQDQHFDLHREEMEDLDDESSLAFDALVEGDAMRIQNAYLDSLPTSEQQAAQQEEAEAGSRVDPSTPRVLLELVVFPYVVGERFADALFEAGGQERVDAAFVTPPTTSEQILHPELYLADGEAPREVRRPKPEAKQIDQGALGELVLFLILRRAVGDEDAFEAAAGWGGDWYVAWRDGDDTCVRTHLVMDTAHDARELRSALRDAEDRFDRPRVANASDVISFTSCG